MGDVRRIAVLNRGEAAVRFCRALKDYNEERLTEIRSVALYTHPDRAALFTSLADETYNLGPALVECRSSGAQSAYISAYVDVERVLSALRETDCDALWPGWGFAAEDADFVARLEEEGITFIGPSSEAMRKLGDKIEAKALAERCDVPLAPWWSVPDELSERSPAEIERALYAQVTRIGLPLMVKASAGGGGRGIRRVSRFEELARVIEEVRAEATRFFGGGGVLLESCIDEARHVEVQLLGGCDGRVITLGLRDCSAQRRHQKIIEEAPAPELPSEVERRLCESAARLAEAAGYQGAGTAEFLYLPQKHEAYFLEVNSRLQVEHTVTECISGVDLVHAQIDVARGLPLTHCGALDQDGTPATLRGWAVEARLCAEDVARGFTPAPGRVSRFRPPSGPGIRVDAGIYEGEVISADFDSMIAKVIAHGSSRRQAFARLRRALSELQVVIEDGATNKALLLELAGHPRVLEMTLNTGWLDHALESGEIGAHARLAEALCFAAVVEYRRARGEDVRALLFSAQEGVPPAPPEPLPLKMTLSAHRREVELTVNNLGGNRYLVTFIGHETDHEMVPETPSIVVQVCFKDDNTGEHVADLWWGDSRFDVFYSRNDNGVMVELDGVEHLIELSSGGAIRAPAPALVVDVSVSVGQRVAVGERLLTLEVMKLEMPILASEPGVVRSIACAANAQVRSGELLLQLDLTSEGANPEDRERDAHKRRELLDLVSTALERLKSESRGRSPAFMIHRGAPMSRELLWGITRSVMLGYDASPELAEALRGQLNALLLTLDEGGGAQERRTPPDMTPWAPIFDLLRCFAEVQVLFDRTPRLEGASSVSDHSLFLETCRLSHLGFKSAPSGITSSLRSALTWYGSPKRGRFWRGALFRLYVAYTHQELRHELCSLLLRLLIKLHSAGCPVHERAGLVEHLDVITRVADARHTPVSDNAAQAKYLLFVQPRYARRSAELDERIAEMLRVAEHRGEMGDEASDEASDQARALIEAPEPISGDLLSQLDPTHASAELGLWTLVSRTYGQQSCEVGEPQRIGSVWSVSSTLDLESGRRDTAENTAENTAETQRTICSLLATLSPDKPWREVLAEWVQRQQSSASVDGVDLFCAGEDATTLFDSQAESWRSAIIQALFEAGGAHCARVTLLAVASGERALAQRTYLRDADPSQSAREERLLRDIHPTFARRFELYRLSQFELRRLPSEEPVYAYLGSARDNPRDERVFVFACIRSAPSVDQLRADPSALSQLEHAYYEGLRVIREAQSGRDQRRRLQWNRLTLYVRDPMQITYEEVCALSSRLNNAASGLGLEKVVVRARLVNDAHPTGQDTVIVVARPGKHRLQISFHEPSARPVRTMDDFDVGVVRARRLQQVYPYELIHLLTGERSGVNSALPHPDLRSGRFVEYDLDERGESLIEINRPYGLNRAAVVVGTITNFTELEPEGVTRVLIINDPTRAMCALAEPECRRVIAALRLARKLRVPVEWVAVSAGAKIAMDSGTENLDWTARVLRELIIHTQARGIVHVIVAGVSVGAQSYWNAEATMLMHTRGLLIMTESGSCVLTGKKALEVSGSVAAEDERGIGGWERVMGPNGQAQLFARDLAEAYQLLMEHYRFTWVRPDESGPRQRESTDPIDRDVQRAPYVPGGRDLDHAGDFSTVGEVFSPTLNPGRKRPFDIRAVMRAVIDQDGGHLERFTGMSEGETAVVWDARLGGTSVCLIGFESRPLTRRGRLPTDGPESWTGGTLFPQSSKKVARAINAASGARPVVVLANLSGFDGSPESLRKLQLEYGAEIGRAVVNFEGPIVFVVIGRYHGGAYVVFSKALNPNLTAFALTGSYASVIGGGPAATVVFSREVKARAGSDARVLEATESLERAEELAKPRLRELLDRAKAEALLDTRRAVADEFDQVHTVERAVEVGSLDRVITPAELRPALIEQLRR